MDTGELLDFMRERLGREEGLPWLSGYTDFGSFREDGPPSGSITLEERGVWLWVKARLLLEGTTMDQTTDRLSGDPYQGHRVRDWIGLASSAPEEAASPEELDEWAKLATEYSCEYTDVGLWGVHERKWVEALSEDGTATVRVAEGRFEDVTPESTATVEEIKLEQ